MYDDYDLPAVYVADRKTYEGATDLIACFGSAADIEASSRADASRAIGNLRHFAYWRQIERLIPILISEDVSGTLH
jgi:hypothetical protein